MKVVRALSDLRHQAISRFGGWLIPRIWPTIRPERISLVSRFFNITVNFILTGVVLWVVIWQLAPGLLGSTAAGMQTLAQAIPATIVALFVFTLGALVGIAQLSINAYGHRSALMLVEDYAVAKSVLRPLILAVTSLVIAGQIPDSGDPSELVTAAFATLAVLTVVVIVQSVGLLGATFLRYTAPLTFSDLVVGDVGPHLSIGVVGLVRWKVPMFEEMAKLAIRRGDSAAMGAALQGLQGMADRYVEETPGCPEARGLTFDEVVPQYTKFAWLGDDLRESLVRIGEDTLRQGAPSEDSDHAVEAMFSVAQDFIRAGLLPEAKRLIDGLIGLGCTSHQVGSGYINHMARPAAFLIRLMRVSQDCDVPHLAAYSLAGWTLVISYADEHFGGPNEPLGRHPNWGPGIHNMGTSPPWQDAAHLLLSRDWQQRWANQMNFGIEFVGLILKLAANSHAEIQQGRPLPPMPTPDELAEDAELAAEGKDGV